MYQKMRNAFLEPVLWTNCLEWPQSGAWGEFIFWVNRPWPLVYNTVSRKLIFAHLLVHLNHRNITSGTGSCTLPVNFLPASTSDNVAKNNPPWDNPSLSSQHFCYHHFNSHEKPRTKRSFFALTRLANNIDYRFWLSKFLISDRQSHIHSYIVMIPQIHKTTVLCDGVKNVVCLILNFFQIMRNYYFRQKWLEGP
jgi:hypothetical protein